ncbi:MAG TPA: carboxypeptidase-like regulatory domain-containing protein [Bryobacteraceae bacterium]|nr:carboxypeptidase-like regulatory domain-containing protein [Bryobacteraceae bacterium]
MRSPLIPLSAAGMVCGAALAALLMAGAFAQDAPQTRKEKREAAAERVVQGTVTDANGKFIEGAVVELKDMRSLTVRSFITQQNGAYHFSGLKLDNDYELLGRYSGMTSGWKTLSVFDTRKEPIINLRLDKPEKQEKSK